MRPIEEQFKDDVAEHRMEVLREDGLYRHIRFQRPESWMYGFDLVTWPGYLAIVGDAGDYVFSRTRDMFQFFALDEGRINPHYWSEKLQAPKSHDAMHYSPEKLRSLLLEHLEDAFRWDSDYEVYPAFLREAVERAGELYDEEDGRRLLRDLEDDGILSDTWEWDLRDYDRQFLWCCHAIAWGVQHYLRTPVEV